MDIAVIAFAITPKSYQTSTACSTSYPVFKNRNCSHLEAQRSEDYKAKIFEDKDDFPEAQNFDDYEILQTNNPKLTETQTCTSPTASSSPTSSPTNQNPQIENYPCDNVMASEFNALPEMKYDISPAYDCHAGRHENKPETLSPAVFDRGLLARVEWYAASSFPTHAIDASPWHHGKFATLVIGCCNPFSWDFKL